MGLEKYIKDSKENIDVAYGRLEAVMMARDEGLEKLKTLGWKLSEDGIREERKKIIEKYEADSQAAVDSCREFVAEQKKSFMAEVNASYSPDGSKIDLNDMQLIRSGITLSDEEVLDMVKKHQGNTTMLRIIDQYISDSKRSLRYTTEDYRYIQSLRKTTTVHKSLEKAFDNFVHLALEGFSHPDGNYGHYRPVQVSLDYYEAKAGLEILKALPDRGDEAVRKIERAENRMNEEQKKSHDILIGWKTGGKR